MEHKIVKIKDKEFKPYIESKEIDRIICQLAERLNRDYAGKKPLLVAILNGAFIFAADLVKKLDFPCRISLIKVSSYSGIESTHNVCELIGLQASPSLTSLWWDTVLITTGMEETCRTSTSLTNRPQSVLDGTGHATGWQRTIRNGRLQQKKSRAFPPGQPIKKIKPC